MNDKYDDDVKYKSFIKYNDEENPDLFWNIDGGNLIKTMQSRVIKF